MIIIAILLSGLAGFLIFGRPPARSLPGRLAPADQRVSVGPSRAHRIRQVAPLLAAVAVPTVLGTVAGVRGFWLGVPVSFVMITTSILVRASVRRRRALAARRQIAQSCSILATQVRIGQSPSVAVRSAAEDCPVLRPAVAVVDLGGDPAAAWRQQSRQPGHRGLAELARAWEIATRTGADMAAALDTVAEGLYEDESVALVVASEAAGPRASGKIMAVLPLAGIGLGYAIGGDPVRFLTGSPYGWGCLGTGTFLACAGVLWMERVADRAAA